MLIDLIATENIISCNIRVAQIIGLEAAIYVNELININSKAIRKDKVSDSYFVLDRKYMENRTTLTEKRQLEIDQTLEQFKLLKRNPDNVNELCVDLEVLTSLLMCENEQLVKEISVSTKKQSKEVKEKANIDRLKSYIKSWDPDIRGAYNVWIESVVEKRGLVTVATVQIAQDTLNRFTTDKTKLVDVIKIAALNGYVDMQYAINTYNQRNVPYAQKNTTQSAVYSSLFDNSKPTFTGKVY